MSEEMIEQIDENNQKALAVLKNMLALFTYDPNCKMNVPALLEVAVSFVNENDKIFKERV